MTSSYKQLCNLHKKERVLVQYRLLKDFDALCQDPIPGVHVRVLEDNVYEWHVTLAPLQGNYRGLRIHMLVLFPEDYPKAPPKVGAPPKVELLNSIPHLAVFSDFRFGPYSYRPLKTAYTICSDLLNPNNAQRYGGWSCSYSVEAVLVQLHSFLFDEYLESDEFGTFDAPRPNRPTACGASSTPLRKRHTLWDDWGEGRLGRDRVCAALYTAQSQSDSCFCTGCGYRGRADIGEIFEDAGDAVHSTFLECGSLDSSAQGQQTVFEDLTDVGGMSKLFSEVVGLDVFGDAAFDGGGALREMAASLDETTGPVPAGAAPRADINSATQATSDMICDNTTGGGAGVWVGGRGTLNAACLDKHKWGRDAGTDEYLAEVISERLERFATNTTSKRLLAAPAPLLEDQDTTAASSGSCPEVSTSEGPPAPGLCYLPRVPGVFKPRDVVCFRFTGVEDRSYRNRTVLNTNIVGIFNFGRKAEELEWVYDHRSGRSVRLNKLRDVRAHAVFEEESEKTASAKAASLHARAQARKDSKKIDSQLFDGEEVVDLAKGGYLPKGVFFEHGVVQDVRCWDQTCDIAVFFRGEEQSAVDGLGLSEQLAKIRARNELSQTDGVVCGEEADGKRVAGANPHAPLDVTPADLAELAAASALPSDLAYLPGLLDPAEADGGDGRRATGGQTLAADGERQRNHGSVLAKRHAKFDSARRRTRPRRIYGLSGIFSSSGGGVAKDRRIGSHLLQAIGDGETVCVVEEDAQRNGSWKQNAATGKKMPRPDSEQPFQHHSRCVLQGNYRVFSLTCVLFKNVPLNRVWLRSYFGRDDLRVPWEHEPARRSGVVKESREQGKRVRLEYDGRKDLGMVVRRSGAGTGTIVGKTKTTQTEAEVGTDHVAGDDSATAAEEVEHLRADVAGDVARSEQSSNYLSDLTTEQSFSILSLGDISQGDFELLNAEAGGGDRYRARALLDAVVQSSSSQSVACGHEQSEKQSSSDPVLLEQDEDCPRPAQAGLDPKTGSSEDIVLAESLLSSTESFEVFSLGAGSLVSVFPKSVGGRDVSSSSDGLSSWLHLSSDGVSLSSSSARSAPSSWDVLSLSSISGATNVLSLGSTGSSSNAQSSLAVASLLNNLKKEQVPLDGLLSGVQEYGVFVDVALAQGGRGPRLTGLLPFLGWMKRALGEVGRGRGPSERTPSCDGHDPDRQEDDLQEDSLDRDAALPNVVDEFLRLRAEFSAGPRNKGRGKNRRHKTQHHLPVYVSRVVVPDHCMIDAPASSSGAPVAPSAPSDRAPAAPSNRERRDCDKPSLKLSLSLLPPCTAADIQVGREFQGIVADTSKLKTLGVFVALSDDFSGLVKREDFGMVASNLVMDEAWGGLDLDRKRPRFRVGDVVRCWVTGVSERGVCDGGSWTWSSAGVVVVSWEGGRQQRQRSSLKIELSLDEHGPKLRAKRWDYLVRPLEALTMDDELHADQRGHHVDSAGEERLLPRDEKENNKFSEAAGSTSKRPPLNGSCSGMTTRATRSSGFRNGDENQDSDDSIFRDGDSDLPDSELLLANSRIVKDASSYYPTASFGADSFEHFIPDLTKEADDRRNRREDPNSLESQQFETSLKNLTKEEKEARRAGRQYYENIAEKAAQRAKLQEDALRKITEEREKYPLRSCIDVPRFRKLADTVTKKGYDCRSCFATGLSYKQDVLGVGLQIVCEESTGRSGFQCSFDLLSKEGFFDFGVKTGVWKEQKLAFWMPAAIDAEHFERAVCYLKDVFVNLGSAETAAKTRSYGTQAGSKGFHFVAQMREAQRGGGRILSMAEFKREKDAERKQVAARLREDALVREGRRDGLEVVREEVRGPDGEEQAQTQHLQEEEESHSGSATTSSGASSSPALSEQSLPRPLRSTKAPSSLTESDMEFALEVLPKLMNSNIVALLKGDLFISAKALEGYIGFHHLLLAVLQFFPKLQTKVEAKIAVFLASEKGRSKEITPNLGEFMCLLAVSKKHTWREVCPVLLKETLDRNASWALDKYPALVENCGSDGKRLERTFKASIVSHRLLVFNAWFLENVVFRPPRARAPRVPACLPKERVPKERVADYPALRLSEYNATRGVPETSDIDALQNFLKKTAHCDGLNCWADYFLALGLRPLNPKNLSALLYDCLLDSLRKGYIPRFKLRQGQVLAAAKRERLERGKKETTADNLGAEVDKFDDMFKGRGGDKW